MYTPKNKQPFLVAFSLMAWLLVVCCKTQETNQETALEIVQNSIEYHGGLTAWTNFRELTYLKKTTLYTANGAVEDSTNIMYTHTMDQGKLSSLMEWLKDGVPEVVLSSEGKITTTSKATDSLKTVYTKRILAAEFVYLQPFKLLEDQALLQYKGLDTLEDGTPVKVVEIAYTNADGSAGNTWWFYFNADSYRLEGNMVHHGSTYAYIRNTAYENKSGLSLNATRTSYRCDSLRNIQYVRAKYEYSLIAY